MKALQLTPYDPLWTAEFEAEAGRITRVCDDLDVKVEHIGSTAIPGVSARPVIDILVGVPPRAGREPYIQALKEIGYDHGGPEGIGGRDYFRRGSPRTHHVHLVEWSSDLWRDHLLFRDYLRENADVRLQFEILKRQLAMVHADDRRRYAAEKGHFIQAVLREARAARAL